MKKVSNNDNDNKKEKGIRNFVDVQAMTILLHLSGNPKTSAEIEKELKEIPKASLYRKIKKLEKFELIRKVTPPHRKPKANNVLYEVTSRKFAMYRRGMAVRITI